MKKGVVLMLVFFFLMGPIVVQVKPVSADSPDSWMSRASMPTARAFFGVAVVDEKIFAIGGAGGVNEVYDPATDTWATRKPMPNPRCFATTLYEGKIYCIGGYSEG